MRALARGLEVLDFLARRDGSTFSDVCLATGLSKAVVHRILAELLSSGHVWRGLEEALFYASASMAIVPKGAQSQALKRAAVGPLVRLVSVVRWPSDSIRQGRQSDDPYRYHEIEISVCSSLVPYRATGSDSAVFRRQGRSGRNVGERSATNLCRS